MFSKVDVSGGCSACWPWMGGRDKDGYGKQWLNGRDVRAHRAVYEAVLGPIPVGLVVMHTCDNPPVGDNVRDMVAKGRAPKNRQVAYAHQVGETHGAHKLTWDEVDEIRYERALGTPLNELASRFNVAFSTISKVALGTTWKQRQRVYQNPDSRPTMRK